MVLHPVCAVGVPVSVLCERTDIRVRVRAEPVLGIVRLRSGSVAVARSDVQTGRTPAVDGLSVGRHASRRIVAVLRAVDEAVRIGHPVVQFHAAAAVERPGAAVPL